MFATPAVLLLAVLPAIQTAPDTVPIYDDLGDHHHEISSTVPGVQEYFDQGLRLVYAFNHAEAIRSFEEAARLDPACAICHWGIALAYGPNINAPMDPASGAAAYAAVQRAVELAPGASEKERAYIEALRSRYAADPTSARPPLDSAYATAMGEVARSYPDDLDAATLHAESLMDLSPWNYWTPAGEPREATPTILAALEGVLERSPDHPGACHFYIHAVEAAEPERAVACAERLARLMPGAGHIVHMPAHIYIRVGRYNDAIESNIHAVHADEQYIAEQRPGGIYPAFYYPHNHHFLSFVAAMAGRRALATEAARDVRANVPVEVAREVVELQGLVPFPHLTLVTFGAWDEVLAEPMPPADLRYSTGLAQYARGVALAATGRGSEALALRDSIDAIAAGLQGDAATALQIASSALAGEVAARDGRPADAVPHFEAALRLEDSFLYVEPPQWYYPIRHSLGAVLLELGRAEEAEALYREDLERFPENGWSLFGLARALRAQGDTDEAADVERRFQEAWGEADVTLAASRF